MNLSNQFAEQTRNPKENLNSSSVVMKTLESEKSMKKSNDKEDDPNLTLCGIGSWRPGWLQVLNRPIYFLINICAIGVIQSMAGAMIYSTMNTVEKRYAFDSKISALIYIADNICTMMISPIIGYYGVRFNRARLIGFGEVILALSCFVTAMPYFIYGSASHFTDSNSPNSPSVTSNLTSNFQMCSIVESVDTENCVTNRGSTVWPAVMMLFAGNFIRGIGFATFYVIAMPFMDDNVDKKNSPIFLSVMQSILILGPAAGFFLSAVCLHYFEDPWNDPGLNLNDPQFIGAWWMGFVFVGILLLIASLPLFFFPAQFKNAPVKANAIKQKMKQSGGTIEAAKRFFKNPILMLFFLGNTARYSGIMGYYMFNAKYVESQYRKSSSSASLFIGSASIIPIAVGILVGGLFISIYKPKARTFLTFLFLVELVSVFTFGSGLFLGCEPIKLVGQAQNDGTYELQSLCNQACDCTTRVFTPICQTQTEQTYFSPCHAGCSSFNSINSTFDSCSCISGSATKGYCPADVTKCDSNLMIYMFALVIGSVISSSSKTGNMLINYRSVEPMDKSFSSGLISSLVSLFSFIPSPLIYGYIADSSCLVWEKKCGKTGNCWLYDQDKFRTVLHTVTIGLLFVGSFFDFVMIFFADRMKHLYDDADQEQQEVGQSTDGNEMKTIPNS